MPRANRRTHIAVTGNAVITSCRRSKKARSPDLLEEVINARQRKAQRGFLDEAPVAHLLMPPITIWGRSTGRAGIDVSVALICCCARTPPVKADEAVSAVLLDARRKLLQRPRRPSWVIGRSPKWLGFRATTNITQPRLAQVNSSLIFDLWALSCRRVLIGMRSRRRSVG